MLGGQREGQNENKNLEKIYFKSWTKIWAKKTQKNGRFLPFSGVLAEYSAFGRTLDSSDKVQFRLLFYELIFSTGFFYKNWFKTCS